MKIRKEKKNEWFELCAIPEKWKEFTDGHMAIPDKCSDCPTYVKENCDRGEMRAEMISEERIYSMAISHWGEDPQLNQLMEELAECIIASNKIRRNANGIDEDEMAEELIDVDIMINQAKHLLPIDIEKFREIKIKKLKRLLDKIQVERETEAENHNLMMNDAMEEDKDGE